MSIGIRTIQILAANQVITSSTALVTVPGLSYALAAGKSARLKYWIPFTLAGTASGAKFEILPPAAPSVYLMSWKLYNGTSTGTLAATAVQTVAGAFSNALAAAANDVMEADLFVTAIAAGTIALQFAQLVSDAGAITLLAGGFVEITQL